MQHLIVLNRHAKVVDPHVLFLLLLLSVFFALLAIAFLIFCLFFTWEDVVDEFDLLL